jgi:hypothetical protein
VTTLESFVELVRASLVNPRRNIDRARLRLQDGQTEAGIKFVEQAYAEILALTKTVEAANKRTYWICDDPMSYYGPHTRLQCSRCGNDRTRFPERGW